MYQARFVASAGEEGQNANSTSSPRMEMSVRRRSAGFLLAFATAVAASATFAQTDSAPVVVHEWGTFTSLQDESGRAIGGINTDDEPVPTFVHRLSSSLLQSPSEVPLIFFQGAPACHPDVTMRLETPVLYFHLPAGQSALHGVNVGALFRGGWLTEFYPNAVVQAPGVRADTASFGALSPDTMGALAWRNLDVGVGGSGPQTQEHVWTAPRDVSAASVRTRSGEVEKFLFYRGVAHIDAPIAASRAGTGRLTLRAQWPAELAAVGSLEPRSLWVVDIEPTGRVAFRVLPAIALDGAGTSPAAISAEFAPGDYSANNRATLEDSLKQALIVEGLFDDEAQALLDTWELSYFKSAGLRVFFMVPRAWTDHYLPLTVSVPAQITRVMVGRIELVTPRDRAYLSEIGQLSAERIAADAQALHESFYGHVGDTPNEVLRGTESLAAYGVNVPKTYQLYLALGRFRNALLLDEASRHPRPALDAFIAAYGLEGYKPATSTAAVALR